MVFFCFSGAIGARLSVDASTVRSLVGDSLALIAQNTSTIMAAIIISFTANWKLSLIVLVLLPFVCSQAYAQAKFLKGFGADAKVFPSAPKLVLIVDLHIYY